MRNPLLPSRRRFLHGAAALGSQTLFPARNLIAQQSMGAMRKIAPPSTPMLQALKLPPFVDPLPLPQRLIAEDGRTLHIPMQQRVVQVHRDVPATSMWVYGDGPVAPLIEFRSHVPAQIEWRNQLPEMHFLPIDHGLHGCGPGVPEVRAVVHLHGGRVPSSEDGGPDDWFVPGRSRTNYYPMAQDACALWYHDHAMGINRLNVYAGLYGMAVIRDAHEEALHLPTGEHEVPLLLCDRNFTANGKLYYPVSGNPEHPWVPEFNADALLVNGKIRPFFEVEPTVYRFRILNAANSRFYRLSFAAENGAHAPMLRQIGSDQGLLASAVDLSSVVLAPAERLDVLFDFAAYAGNKVTLRHAAFDMLQFRVRPAHHAVSVAKAAATAPSPPASLRTIERLKEVDAVQTRRMTLHEYDDNVGMPEVMLINRKHWHEPVTETPKLNTTEIWEFVNLTEDTHPMHLHLVRFQVLDRRNFDSFAFLMHRELRYTAPAVAPSANEMGWKDVVQCPPSMITRIAIQFDGYAGRYLYHCHILEHEANDMMRPYEVLE